ncbi:hypothetical protein PINS_up014566 [Pythium insidiosum]|nr:hypothetical protein PINS_up014566 [Pythium insidiosum]
MLHSLLVVNEEHYVLLARYFQPSLSLDARKRYEAKLARVTEQHLPPLSSKAPSAALAEPHLLCVDGQYVVLRQLGELRVFLAGANEYDELILADILTLFHAVLVTQLEKKLTETSLLANYAKVVAAVDEMVQQGHLETAEESAIEQMSKLKPFPVK